MFKKTLATGAFALLACTALAGQASARDQIRIVGSSTVFPFSTAVAEQFAKTSSFKAPVVESTGTGGGMKLFCAGVGTGHPDMTNASRRMKSSEFEQCQKNGVEEVPEVKTGFDGIVFANDKSGPKVDLSKRDIWLALAKEIPIDGKLQANPYTMWNQIRSDLPATKIEVLGPPPTSGTRDAFVEIVMEEGCKEVAGTKELGLEGKKCHIIREDGIFVEAGENDNLIVQKLSANPNAFGIFGFSFLDQNADKVKGATIGGVEPTFENIADGKYGVSRSLFFYVKNAHAGVIPGMKEFVAEFTSPAAWGPNGYLSEKGLIPLPDAERKKVGDAANAMTPLTM